jgi:hypothetical protein
LRIKRSNAILCVEKENLEEKGTVGDVANFSAFLLPFGIPPWIIIGKLPAVSLAAVCRAFGGANCLSRFKQAAICVRGRRRDETIIGGVLVGVVEMGFARPNFVPFGAS